MEDRWNVALHKNGNAAVFAVFDGHGGAQVSNYLMENLSRKVFQDRELDSDPVGVLKRSFHECDEDVVAEHDDDSHRKRYPGPGSTAVVVLILPPKAFVAHVGDSRAIFVNSKGQIVFQTKDQRPDCPLEHSRILRLGGTVRAVRGVVRASGILAVSRAFGNAGFKHFIKADPEIAEINLSEAAELLYCSETQRSVPSSSNDTPRNGYQGRGNTRSSKRSRSGVLKPPNSSQDCGANPDCSTVRRIAKTLTGLAKIRQSTDNISVVTLSIQRTGLQNDIVRTRAGARKTS
mmetsp:Transcript_10405/g.43089  ORF Transcript_10405/g.43089 Transcript_10405/m.43089 type:complete len:290 (-) Transcript_10405:3877-4746(-)